MIWAHLMKQCNETMNSRDVPGGMHWDYFPDLSFLCNFDFFFHWELCLVDSAVLSWLALATWVMCQSMPWESSLDVEATGHDFSELWPFFLCPMCLETWVLFLGEWPAHAPSCEAVGGAVDPCNIGRAGGSNPLHLPMCLFICWQDGVTALRQVPHAKFML